MLPITIWPTPIAIDLVPVTAEPLPIAIEPSPVTIVPVPIAIELEPVDKELVPIAIAFSPTLVRSCRVSAFFKAVNLSWFCCNSCDLAVNCCINDSYWSIDNKSDALGLIASQFVLAWSAEDFKAAICFSFSAIAFLLIWRAFSKSEVSLFVVILFFSKISVMFSFFQFS